MSKVWNTPDSADTAEGASPDDGQRLAGLGDTNTLVSLCLVFADPVCKMSRRETSHCVGAA